MLQKLMCACRQEMKGEKGVPCEQSYRGRTVKAIVRELCAGLWFLTSGTGVESSVLLNLGGL